MHGYTHQKRPACFIIKSVNAEKTGRCQDTELLTIVDKPRSFCVDIKYSKSLDKGSRISYLCNIRPAIRRKTPGGTVEKSERKLTSATKGSQVLNSKPQGMPGKPESTKTEVRFRRSCASSEALNR